jgi:hypothetical protein
MLKFHLLFNWLMSQHISNWFLWLRDINFWNGKWLTKSLSICLGLTFQCLLFLFNFFGKDFLNEGRFRWRLSIFWRQWRRDKSKLLSIRLFKKVADWQIRSANSVFHEAVLHEHFLFLVFVRLNYGRRRRFCLSYMTFTRWWRWHLEWLLFFHFLRKIDLWYLLNLFHNFADWLWVNYLYIFCLRLAYLRYNQWRSLYHFYNFWLLLYRINRPLIIFFFSIELLNDRRYNLWPLNS